MPPKTEIRVGYVYANSNGDRRLVFSIDTRNSTSTVLWRTANPELPKEVKAQGSCTVKSFSRWPVNMELATTEDREAFDVVARRREWTRRDRRAVRRIMRASA